jgi:hypothetical protein
VLRFQRFKWWEKAWSMARPMVGARVRVARWWRPTASRGGRGSPVRSHTHAGAEEKTRDVSRVPLGPYRARRRLLVEETAAI